MKTSIQKIKATGKTLGVKIKVDKALDKFSSVVPDKMKNNQEYISNSKFKF